MGRDLVNNAPLFWRFQVLAKIDSGGKLKLDVYFLIYSLIQTKQRTL